MIIILTGNIGVGKSSLASYLYEYNLEIIDVIDVNSVSETNLVNEMYGKIVTNLFKGKGSIVEFTGSEAWMKRLIEKCKALNTNVLEFEVYNTSNDTIDRIDRRSRDEAKLERQFASKHKDSIFNKTAHRICNDKQKLHEAVKETKRIIDESFKN